MQALDEEKDVEVGDSEQSMPVIIKKEHDNLGMLEYNKEQEDKLLRVIITELKPRLASQMLPGLPAYILFMLIRHLDHINDDKNVRSLIQGAISQVKKTIKKRGQTDIELKTLWLSNVLRLLHCLKQYSGETQFQAQSTAMQVQHCLRCLSIPHFPRLMRFNLRNFDLSAYRRVLSDIAVWIYQGITKVMEEEIQPVLVIALLEHEGNTKGFKDNLRLIALFRYRWSDQRQASSSERKTEQHRQQPGKSGSCRPEGGSGPAVDPPN